ncbi:hypothetical protein [Sphingobacterium paludis]|uniref:Uncharacterized protein n=1 Tax=Sphingobacterium paludis TaxID=1476465 RepID=A0A4R7D7T3_9SPHI|nr:hypothetical protein [Sphingobacterium paludis]TDS17263.1 hypothetical protein B0I21_101125 [Sphingobacterium paludis]
MEEKENKHHYLNMFLWGLLIILVICTAVHLLNVWVFPDSEKFDPEIWGTVSDWMMIFVTLSTAVFLYVTLQSQKDVQRDQNKIFKMEEFKYLRSIKPSLSIHSSHRHSWNGNTLNGLEIFIDINCDPSCQIKYSIKTSASEIISEMKEYRLVRTYDITIFLPLSSKRETIEKVLYEFNFKDVDGNEYCRSVEEEFSPNSRNGYDKKITNQLDKLVNIVY